MHALHLERRYTRRQTWNKLIYSLKIHWFHNHGNLENTLLPLINLSMIFFDILFSLEKLILSSHWEQELCQNLWNCDKHQTPFQRNPTNCQQVWRALKLNQNPFSWKKKKKLDLGFYIFKMSVLSSLLWHLSFPLIRLLPAFSRHSQSSSCFLICDICCL